MTSKYLVIIGFLFSAQFIFAERNIQTDEHLLADENKSDNIFIVCGRQKEIRWLRAFKLENGRCKTYYSKEGYVQVVSAASYFSSCAAVLDTVKKNIEEGGFKCAEKNLASMIEIE